METKKLPVVVVHAATNVNKRAQIYKFPNTLKNKL